MVTDSLASLSLGLFERGCVTASQSAAQTQSAAQSTAQTASQSAPGVQVVCTLLQL